jgi:hypothetical protein
MKKERGFKFVSNKVGKRNLRFHLQSKDLAAIWRLICPDDSLLFAETSFFAPSLQRFLKPSLGVLRLVVSLDGVVHKFDGTDFLLVEEMYRSVMRRKKKQALAVGSKK